MWLNYSIVKMSFNKDIFSGISTRYEFSDSGLKIKNKINDYTYDWNIVYKIKSLPLHFIIYLSKNSSLVIPKRVFKNQEELDRFLSIITTRVSPVKLQLRGCKIDQIDFNEESIISLNEENIDILSKESINISSKESINISSKEANKSDEKPLEHLRFRINKSIHLDIALTVYFKEGYGKVVTFFAILFLAIWAFNIKNSNIDNLFEIYVLTMLSIIVTLIPFRTVRSILRGLEEVNKAGGYHIAYNENQFVLYLPKGDMHVE